MKSYRTLALKELLAQRVISILILLAIILSAMMTAVIGQSVGVLSAMRQQQAITISGNRYAGFVQLDKDQVEILRNDPRLSFVGVSLTLGNLTLDNSLVLGLNEFYEDALEAYPALRNLKEGRLPQNPCEVALPEDVLQYLGFSGQLGDTITLPLSKTLRHGVETSSYEFTAQMTLVGISESNYLHYAAGVVCGIVGEGTAEALLPDNYTYYNVDIRTKDKKTFQATMDDLAAALNIHELDTIYNLTYLHALGISYSQEKADTAVSDNGFPLLTAAGVMVGVLILLAAGLVVYNILKIAVSRRMKQYGTLRAIGGEKGQLYSLVTIQVLLLCTVGIPIGLLLGVLSAKGILTAAMNILSPDIFLVQDAQELNRLIADNSSWNGIFLLASAVLTLLFALAAALPAAKFAAEISPVSAMAGTNVKIRRRSRSTKGSRHFERYYARINLKRNPGRTAITILSLVMSVTVFIALQSSVALLDASGGEAEHLGDYSIVNETVGFPPEELKVMETDERVKSVAALQFSLYQQSEQGELVGIKTDLELQPGETFQVLGANEHYWETQLGSILSPDILEKLKAGEGCLVRNPISIRAGDGEMTPTTILEGDTITVSGRELTVLKTFDDYDIYFSVGNNGFTNGVQVVVSEALYYQLTGKTEYNELLPKLMEGLDRDEYDSTVEELAKRIPGTIWLSYEDTDRQLAESFEQIRLLAWGLILFITLIGLLNIVNTVYTNIQTRVPEIGTQRAIGMSVRSLYKVFLWEGAYYGLFAAGIGSVAGYLCTVVIETGIYEEFRFAAVPVIPILEGALCSIMACLLATGIPLGRIAKMDIVTSIEAVE